MMDGMDLLNGNEVHALLQNVQIASAVRTELNSGLEGGVG